MKKNILILIFCLLGISLFAQTKKTIAVLEFEGGSVQDAITLADVFGSILANKNVFDVLTRTSVEAIMKEHKFQRTGNVTNEETKKQIGELVNADYIISGKITTLGNVSLLTVQMINVVTDQLEAGVHESFKNVGDALPYIETMVDKIVGIESEGKPNTSKKYKIGDTGPGGGMVFYIGGTVYEGYTYYECSKVLGKAVWQEAKQMGKNYRGGGYTNWYLPSEEELNYIYENLAKKGFIEQTGSFWSSSESNHGNAWLQYFSNGGQGYFYEAHYYSSVRVVRALNP